jgi:hypothetical protein
MMHVFFSVHSVGILLQLGRFQFMVHCRILLVFGALKRDPVVGTRLAEVYRRRHERLVTIVSLRIFLT